LLAKEFVAEDLRIHAGRNRLEGCLDEPLAKFPRVGLSDREDGRH
jgi:hypothetical protein